LFSGARAPTTGDPGRAKCAPEVATPQIPAFCYIISDITPTLKKVLKTDDAILTPDNQGYYGFHKTYAAYYEVIDYNKLLSDARKRNRIFFDRSI